MAQINFIRTDDINTIEVQDGNFIITKNGDIYADFPDGEGVKRIRVGGELLLEINNALGEIINLQTRFVSGGS